jgi:hypothetical protein
MAISSSWEMEMNEFARRKGRRVGDDLLALVTRLAAGRVVPRTVRELCIAAEYGQQDAIAQSGAAARSWVVPGCDFSVVPAAAASSGHFALLRWLHEHGCPWDSKTCTAAAGRGNILMLLYATVHGCGISSFSASAAAFGNHRHIIEWIRATGHVRAFEGVCESAARGGNLQLLQWLLEQVRYLRAD